MNLLEKKVRILESIIKLAFSGLVHPDTEIIYHTLPDSGELWRIEVTDIYFTEDLLTVLQRLREKFRVDISSDYKLLDFGKHGKINAAKTNLELWFNEEDLLREEAEKRK